MLFPPLRIAIIRLVQCVEDARAGIGVAPAELIVEHRATNKAKTAYRSFFLLFLLYPLSSRTTFHIVMPTACQTLLDDAEYHMDDYSIDCAAGNHVVMIAVAVMCIAIYPMGVPVVFLLLLRSGERNRSDSIQQQYTKVNQPKNETAPAAQLDSGMQPPLLALSAFDFLRKDYKPEYYY